MNVYCGEIIAIYYQVQLNFGFHSCGPNGEKIPLNLNLLMLKNLNLFELIFEELFENWIFLCNFIPVQTKNLIFDG
jgi:hypothetical protein